MVATFYRIFSFVFLISYCLFFFFFQAEDGIRDDLVTGVQTCALPISHLGNSRHRERLCDWKVVEGSELIPQLPPAIDISVRYVEDFVACFVFTQSPQSRAPEQLCVCCLLKSIPSLLRARKA